MTTLSLLKMSHPSELRGGLAEVLRALSVILLYVTLLASFICMVMSEPARKGNMQATHKCEPIGRVYHGDVRNGHIFGLEDGECHWACQSRVKRAVLFGQECTRGTKTTVLTLHPTKSKDTYSMK